MTFTVQTQLYRLAEHFLRKANLPVIRRTAETELAVADAINIEKGVADRSNSKVVYLNLCSRELLHDSNRSKSSTATESNTSSSEVPIDGSEQVNNELSTDPVILEALRNAGLVSDSPPNSPLPEKEVLDEADPSIREEGLDNIFDMDSHPELDIYGDFEYDLEDEDYIGATSTKVSKLPPEEGASKMKVVFSTLTSERLNNCLDFDDHEKSGKVEAPKDSNSDTVFRSTISEGETDNSCVPPEPLINENSEEPSIAECEELYGPDKEPLIKKFPEVASRKQYGQVATVGDNSTGSAHSPNQFQKGENVESKEHKSGTETSKQSDSFNHVFKKVADHPNFIISLISFFCLFLFVFSPHASNFT